MPPQNKKRKLYTRQMLDNALLAVGNGMSYGNASKAFNIPKTTLIYKNSGKIPMTGKPGPPTLLSSDEEDMLVKWLIFVSNRGFPATRNQLADSIELLFKYMKKENPFPSGRPTIKWHQLFEKRHPEIAVRVAQNLSKPRSTLNENSLRNWHAEVYTYLKNNNLENVLEDPKRVYNCDESAFFLSPKGNRVLARKGEKAVYSFSSNDDKECLTTLIMCNAAGDLPPPMVVFPYKRIPPKISNQAPKHWGLGRSDNGWMTGETFFEYIANVFYKWLTENNISFPVLLFVDGHSSHLTLTLSKFCSEKKIILVALYPNATHIIQPLDVAFFRPLKMSWKTVVHTWRLENNGAKISREDFAPLLQKSIDEMENKTKIISNGFRATGLFPFEVDNINFSKYFKNDIEISEACQSTIKKQYNNCYTINTVLKRMEMDLPDKIEIFKNTGAVWKGDTRDTGLYEYWKFLKAEKNKYNEHDESQQNEEIDMEINQDILPIANSSPSKSIDNIITEVLEENADMSNIDRIILDGDSLVIPFDINQEYEILDTDSIKEPNRVAVPPKEENSIVIEILEPNNSNTNILQLESTPSPNVQKQNNVSALSSIENTTIGEQPNKISTTTPDSIPTPFKRVQSWRGNELDPLEWWWFASGNELFPVTYTKHLQGPNT
ncbi:jerky protein homolog-like [Sitophilus oryzae]|uniref:Jerky protein homolog-like n=1 Tax=Sitophilus oryzae TaxID=7048 RepID=A0A6J2X9W2_SITOR|nr:jerky protein homolog-like [Sitophilus oryzae]